MPPPAPNRPLAAPAPAPAAPAPSQGPLFLRQRIASHGKAFPGRQILFHTARICPHDRGWNSVIYCLKNATEAIEMRRNPDLLAGTILRMERLRQGAGAKGGLLRPVRAVPTCAKIEQGAVHPNPDLLSALFRRLGVDYTQDEARLRPPGGGHPGLFYPPGIRSGGAGGLSNVGGPDRCTEPQPSGPELAAGPGMPGRTGAVPAGAVDRRHDGPSASPVQAPALPGGPYGAGSSGHGPGSLPGPGLLCCHDGAHLPVPAPGTTLHSPDGKPPGGGRRRGRQRLQSGRLLLHERHRLRLSPTRNP